MKPKERWLRLTEETNALDYLEKAHDYIGQTESSDIAWKWVVLSLHGALYGFAICSLKGTNYDRVLKKDGRLISFGEALKRCQDSRYMRMTIMSRPLQLSAQERDSIRILRQHFRNNFEHYRPKLWYIELHGMSQIAICVLRVIRFLALDAGNYVNLTSTQ